jgi:hypothetical protein
MAENKTIYVTETELNDEKALGVVIHANSNEETYEFVLDDYLPFEIANKKTLKDWLNYIEQFAKLSGFTIVYNPEAQKIVDENNSTEE